MKTLLSETWKQLTEEQIEKFVKLINYRNEPYVEINEVFLFFILSGYRLPSAAEIEDYRLKLTNYESMAAISR